VTETQVVTYSGTSSPFYIDQEVFDMAPPKCVIERLLTLQDMKRRLPFSDF
jgi:hypothetical protein